MTAALAGCLLWVLFNCACSSDAPEDDTRRTLSASGSPPLVLQRCASGATSVLVGFGVAGLAVALVGAAEVEITEMLIDVLACKTGLVAWIWLQRVASVPRGRNLATGSTTCALVCVAASLMVAFTLTV